MAGSISQSNAVAAEALHSYGTQLFSAAYTPTTPDVLTLIGQVKSISRDGNKYTEVDVSHLFSPEKFKEFIAGFGDAGTITFNCNYNPALNAQLTDLEPDPSDVTEFGRIRLIISDPLQNTITFKGFMNGPGQNFQEDGQIMIAISFRCSGKPVVTLVG